jgi:hypothetical protein
VRPELLSGVSEETKKTNRYKMPAMAGRAVNITARILFFLSGVVSLAVAALFAMLRGSDLPSQSEWVIFTVILGLVGAISVLAAVFPAAWTARVCRVKDKSSLFSRPLRVLGVFAVVSYLLTVAFFFTPREWNLSGYLWTFLLCPAYIVRVTLDPNAVELFLILAPIDAAGYGGIGTVVGFWLAASRKLRASEAAPFEPNVRQ